MKKLIFTTLIAFVTAFFISACSKTEEVSYETLEQARAQASDNAETNAQLFRQASPLYKDFGVVKASDSTQSKDCPQGDGWASIKLLNTSSGSEVGLKCSTASLSIGCLEDADFKSKSYASTDGKCSTEVPFPIPKLTK